MHRFPILRLWIALTTSIFLGCKPPTRLETSCRAACQARPCPGDAHTASCEDVCRADTERIPDRCESAAERWYGCQQAARWVCTPLGAVTMECERPLNELVDCLPGTNLVRSDQGR